LQGTVCVESTAAIVAARSQCSSRGRHCQVHFWTMCQVIVGTENGILVSFDVDRWIGWSEY